MTRTELLKLLIAQARTQGFEFRRWYVTRLERKWEGAAEAVSTLSDGRRYYALLFSHDFATCFWKAGTRMTLQLPAQSFLRTGRDGIVKCVVRKGHFRRMTREDAWEFHLREMAATEEPLRYIRRFLRVEEELETKIASVPAEQSIVIVDEEDLLPDED